MLLEWLCVSVDSLLTLTPTGLYYLDLHAKRCVSYYTTVAVIEKDALLINLWQLHGI